MTVYVRTNGGMYSTSVSYLYLYDLRTCAMVFSKSFSALLQLLLKVVMWREFQFNG